MRIMEMPIEHMNYQFFSCETHDPFCVCVLVLLTYVCTHKCCFACVCLLFSVCMSLAQCRCRNEGNIHEICCNQKRRQKVSTAWGRLVYVSPQCP